MALLGANGAGKTTTLKAISNLLRAERGDVTKGSIEFVCERVDRLTLNDLVRRGVIQVMEGRHCFEHLTIEENLLTGSYTRRDGRGAIQKDLDMVYGYFPQLKERRGAQAGYTSGGEQQMCVIGRALMSRPKMILLAEHNTDMALRYAKYGYILENGRVVLDGEAAALSQNEDVKEFYLGISASGRKSYRATKHYKRRKRWLA